MGYPIQIIRTLTPPLIALCLMLGSNICGAQKYSNPVIPLNCPDPTILDDRAESGWFYVYSTQTSPTAILNKDSSPTDASAPVINLPIYRSRNLTDWEFVCDGFPDGKPSWVKGSKLWAPDMNVINGKYVLYYALGKWASLFESASGVAVSDTPTGPFRDLGIIAGWSNMRTVNSIDPNYFEDPKDGRKYLYWGSLGGGIWGAELSEDGLSINPQCKKVHLTGRNTEAAYMYFRDGWYYLFASAGTCCKGKDSSYRIVVGRSRNPLGPFKGPDGQKMTSISFSNAIMSGTDDKEFTGPGHNAEIITDDSGSTWMLYHCYEASNSYNGRLLHLDQVLWDRNGWPYFEYGHPSTSSECPEFSR